VNGRYSAALAASRTLRILDQALFHLHDLALRRPGLTLVGALLAVAALGTQIPGTRVLLAIGDFVEETLPSTLWNRQLREDFESGNSVIVIFKPRTAGERLTPQAIERIATWIERERSTNPELLRVVSPFDLRRVRLAAGRFWSWPVVRDKTPEGLGALRESPWDRILTDSTAVDVAVEFVFRDTPGGSRYGSFDPKVIGSLERRYTDEVLAKNEEVEAHLLGTATFQHYSLEGIRRFRVLNLGVLALVLILCRALLGTWRSGALLIGVLIVAGLTVYGTMGLAGAPIDLLSTGLFLMLSVAALEDYLFLSYQQLRHGTEWRSAFRDMLVPSFFTSLTTMIGFGSLVASDLALVRRFGTWAAYGAGVRDFHALARGHEASAGVPPVDQR
jgi:predicted RND superfamily exporter protein